MQLHPCKEFNIEAVTGIKSMQAVRDEMYPNEDTHAGENDVIDGQKVSIW